MVVPDPTTPAGVPVPSVANPTYFAEGTNTAVNTLIDAGWITQPAAGGATVYGAGYKWPLLKGALRVEARQSGGNYVAVTREWLELGFARGLAVPKVDTETTTVQQCPSQCHPDLSVAGRPECEMAISLTRAKAQLPGDLQPVSTGFQQTCTTPREGELRPSGTNGDCNVGGIMNTTELDVGNLKKWLAGTIGTTGTLVESSSQNGYILYFSDRRGMLLKRQWRSSG